MVTVYVCKKCKGRDQLVDFLRHRAGVAPQSVGCQKVCKHPVAGLVVNGRMEWFSRLDRPKRMLALMKIVAAGGRVRLPRALEKCRVPKRSGRVAR